MKDHCLPKKDYATLIQLDIFTELSSEKLTGK
jgi:hypothetical protein